MAFTQDQTLTAKCMPELVRMVNDASSNDKIMDTLEFIKTEDGQMQCLRCQNIFTDKETHQTQCFKPSDNDEGHVYSNAIGEGPKMDGVPLPESSYQLSCFTGIKEELPDFDNFCTEIKIEPMETNINSVNQSTESEDLMQCLNCKLYFNDRCAYLDHKMFSCNASFDQLTNVGLSNSVDTVESFETPIKTELLDEAQTLSDRGPINIEIPYDQDMSSFEMVHPQPPKFTCSCTICDAVFDDFFIFDIHTKVCKRPRIGTVIEDLNLSKTKCAICKENFQSILDLSKHMVSTHVGGNAKRDAKKRKHAETDFNEYTWQSPATIARGLTRNVNRIRCYFGTCVETFVTLSDFKSHYTMHLQSTRTSTKQNEQASVNVAAFREIAAHRLQKECKLLGKHETEKNKSNGDRLDMNKQIPRRDFEGYTFLNNSSKSDNGSDDIYKCPKDGCANSFLSKQAVQRRIRVQKTYNLVFANGKQVHQCQFNGCGRLFDTRKLLKDHNRSTHMNKKSAFQCLYKSCGRSFDTKKLLTEHIQDIHIADVRKRKSKRLSHYTLYTCTLCLNTFQSKDVVFKHLHEEHRVIGTINSNLYAVEKLLLCSVCKRYVGLSSFLEHSKKCQKKKALHQHSQEIFKPGNQANVEHQFKQTKDIDEHRAKHDDNSTEHDIVKDLETYTTKHDKSIDEEINANNGGHCTKHDDKATEQESRSNNGGNYTKHDDKIVEQGIKTENDEIFTRHDGRLTENDKMTDNDERHAKHDDNHERYTKHDKSSTKHDDKLTDQEMEKSDAKKLSKIISSGAYEYWQDYLQRLIEIRDKYMCNICTLTFCYKNEILTHLVKTHGLQDRFSENMTYVGIAHGCKLCRFAFPQQHVIWGHLVSMHAVLDSEPALETCSKVTGKSVEQIKEDISILTQAGDYDV